jgi:hypothetical protein
VKKRPCGVKHSDAIKRGLAAKKNPPTLKTVRRDVRLMIQYLMEGFVPCPRCGNEDTTSDLDVVSDLRDLAMDLARMDRATGGAK